MNAAPSSARTTPAAAPRAGRLGAASREESAARKARVAIKRDIERDLRAKARAKLAALHEQLRAARLGRKNAVAAVVTRCRTDRHAVREQSRMEWLLTLERLRSALHAERQGARDACAQRREEAKRSTADAIERARGELEAERKYQEDLKRIERGNRQRHHEARRSTARERSLESDDEVRVNIPAELVGLFERVKRGIKGSVRETRTEAFLRYAEEHPSEVLEAIDDKTDRLIRDLERQEREAARNARRKRYTPAELAAVPF